MDDARTISHNVVAPVGVILIEEDQVARDVEVARCTREPAALKLESCCIYMFVSLCRLVRPRRYFDEDFLVDPALSTR
jgi:hypothetical protein